jgi:glycosyltransferase involved in cell wall biosynthesis
LKTREKIAIVANTSWSIYNFRLGLITHLQKLGFQIIAIAPKDDFSAKLQEIGCDYVPLELDSYSRNPLHDINIAFQLRAIYREYRPDIIFHYTIKPNIYGSIAAWWCKIPSIAVTTGLGILSNTSVNCFAKSISLLLYRLAGRLTNEMWFLNEPNRQVFIKKNIISPAKAHILPSEGVDTEWFKPSDPLMPKSSRNHLNFLFAGRFIRDKGIFELAEAARLIIKRYPQARFQVLGFVNSENPSCISETQLKNWESEKILTYLGETTDVRPYLENADCVVYPSYYGEGLSRILLEAGAMGIPIITTDNVGCQEVVIPNVSGFICKSRNVTDLVKKIELFIGLTPTRRKKMGEKSREYVVSNFRETIVIELYMEAIKRNLLDTSEVFDYFTPSLAIPQVNY